MAEAGVNLRETDAELQQSFREYENGIAFDNSRRAAVFAGVFMLAGFSLDLVMVAQHGTEFFVIRATSAILLGLIFWYMGAAKSSRLGSKIAAQGIALLPLLAICTMIAVTDGGIPSTTRD